MNLKAIVIAAIGALFVTGSVFADINRPHVFVDLGPEANVLNMAATDLAANDTQKSSMFSVGLHMNKGEGGIIPTELYSAFYVNLAKVNSLKVGKTRSAIDSARCPQAYPTKFAEIFCQFVNDYTIEIVPLELELKVQGQNGTVFASFEDFDSDFFDIRDAEMARLKLAVAVNAPELNGGFVDGSTLREYEISFEDSKSKARRFSLYAFGVGLSFDASNQETRGTAKAELLNAVARDYVASLILGKHFASLVGFDQRILMIESILGLEHPDTTWDAKTTQAWNTFASYCIKGHDRINMLPPVPQLGDQNMRDTSEANRFLLSAYIALDICEVQLDAMLENDARLIDEIGVTASKNASGIRPKAYYFNRSMAREMTCRKNRCTVPFPNRRNLNTDEMLEYLVEAFENAFSVPVTAQCSVHGRRGNEGFECSVQHAQAMKYFDPALFKKNLFYS